MTYGELIEALAVFGLSGPATLQTIRKRHRQLCRKYHPDTGADPDNDMIRRVNNACSVLEEYVSNYRFDFSKETFFDQFPEERLREQFYNSGL